MPLISNGIKSKEVGKSRIKTVDTNFLTNSHYLSILLKEPTSNKFTVSNFPL